MNKLQNLKLKLQEIIRVQSWPWQTKKSNYEEKKFSNFLKPWVSSKYFRALLYR